MIYQLPAASPAIGNEPFFLILTLFLLLTLIIGMVRILRGPSPADRMLAAQLFGTTGVAIFLLLAETTANPALRDIGLVYALLAAVTSVSFVRRTTNQDRS